MVKEYDLKTERQKQHIYNAFAEIGIYPKIKISPVGGYYIYHQYATPHKRNGREIVSQTENRVTYRRYKIHYCMDLILNDDQEDFENSLKSALHVAKLRKEFN